MTDHLDNYLKLKNEAIQYLKEIDKSISKSQFKDLFEGSTRETIETLQADKLIVAVVGVIKRGKSTLLNALLKTNTEILSTNATPETARLSFLNYSDQPKAIIYSKDKESIEITLDKLPLYTSAYNTVQPKGEKEKVEKTIYAEIFYPNEILQKGICIIDTPGVDDPDETRSKVTLDFIDTADAVIFLIDVVEGGLKDSELKFLQAKILNNQGTSKGIIVVCNKILALRKHQKPQLDNLIKKTEATLNNFFNININVLPVDSLAAFEGYGTNNENLIEQSNFEIFKSTLEEYLVREKGKIILRTRLNKIINERVNPLVNKLEEISNRKPLTLQECEKSLYDAEKKNLQLKKKAEQTFQKFEEQKENILRGVKKQINSEFNSKINLGPENIQNITPSIVALSKSISNKAKGNTIKLTEQICEEFALYNIKIEKPEFNLNIKQIEISKYYSKDKKIKSVSDDLGAVGMVAGGIFGFILGGFFPPAIYFGAKLGQAAANYFGGGGIETIETKYDELGLMKEIDSIKKALYNSISRTIDYYLNDFKESISNYFNDQKKMLLIEFDNQKKILSDQTKSFEDYRLDITHFLKSLNENVHSLKKIIDKVEAL